MYEETKEYLFKLDPNICLIVCNEKKSIYAWKGLKRNELNEIYKEKYNKKYNKGIVTGFTEDNDEYGILGIDIDDKTIFDEYIKKNNINRKEIENTYTEKTPSGSIHYYYKIDKRLKYVSSGQNYPCEKVDYRCNGGYMICYGSKFTKKMCIKKNNNTNTEYHRCGGTDEKCYYENKPYEIINNTSINNLPESWVNIFIPINEKDKQKYETNNNEEKQKYKTNHNYDKQKSNEKEIKNNVEWKIIKLLFDRCYKQDRFENYDDWLKVGMAIKNKYGEEGVELFKYYSKKAREYDNDKELEKKYNTFSYDYENGITLKTIFYIAKEDNKEEYTNIIRNKLIFNNIELTSTDVVKYIKILSNRFMWVKQTLYCYNGTYWENDDIEMKKYIGNDLYEFLKDIYMICYLGSVDAKEMEKITSSLRRLKTLTFKKEIVETSRETLTNNTIRFDNNPYLLGFTNCVYDLEKQEFREYKYDDYITITTGYEWEEPTDEQIDTVKCLIRSIFPVEEECKTFLNILATGLEGKCLERFIIFNGEGRNGKGLINDLYLTGLGEYGYIANNAMLFEKRKTGCNPEISNLDKKRYVIFRELPQKCKFENSIVKELTGGGSICARGLYESNTTKELNLTCIVECNKRPIFAEEPQRADMERIIDILFKVTFTTKKEEVDPENNILMANPYYKEKKFQSTHKCALLKILFDVYKEYKENNYDLCVSKSINDRTLQYLQMSSDIIGWIEDNYEKTDNIKDVIKLREMWNLFKESEYYNNLSKSDKRKYNEKYFIEQISSNIFLRKYYYERKFINNTYYRNIISNHIIKTHNDELFEVE